MGFTVIASLTVGFEYGLVYGSATHDANLVGAYFTLDPTIAVATAVLFLGEVVHRGQGLRASSLSWALWLAAANPASNASAACP